jgi:hypothetical protein
MIAFAEIVKRFRTRRRSRFRPQNNLLKEKEKTIMKVAATTQLLTGYSPKGRRSACPGGLSDILSYGLQIFAITAV